MGWVWPISSYFVVASHVSSALLFQRPDDYYSIETLETVWRSPAGTVTVRADCGTRTASMLCPRPLSLYLAPRLKCLLSSIFCWQTITGIPAGRCAARVYHSAVIVTPRTTAGGSPARRLHSASFRSKSPEPQSAPARLRKANTRSFGMEDQRYLRGSLSSTTIPSPAAGLETNPHSLRSHSDDPYIVGVNPIGDDVKLDGGVMEGESNLPSCSAPW
jgi:hypothetical protein